MPSRITFHQKRLMTNAARLTLVFVATIVFGTILFTSSSAHKNTGGPLNSADAGRLMSKGSSEGSLDKVLATGGTNKTALSAFLPQAGPSPEVIETFAFTAGSCTAVPKSSFVLGETVCARLSGGPPLSLYPRKFAWISNNNVIYQRTDVITDPQTDTFVLPGLDPDIDHRGVWRVIDMSAADSSVRTAAYFSVSNPTAPAVNLAIYKSNDTDGSITAGSNILFALWLTNYGPDTATSVTITDATPTHTTFLSGDASPGVVCTFPATGSTGTTNCTMTALPQGASAKVTIVANVDPGTSAGTIITNSATIANAVEETYTKDNTGTSDVTVVSGAPGATCTLDCPTSITANANTTEGGQRGAHVNYPPVESAGGCGSVSSTPASGSFFPVGTTVVTATSETGGGECTFNVTVEEANGNVSISCPSDPPPANANGDCEAIVAVGTPTVVGDNVTFHGTRSDGKPMYNCDCFPNSPNQQDDACNTNGACSRRTDAPFASGVTTITWIAFSHDVAGPYATPEDEVAHRTGSASCVESITVNDVTPPVITATDQTVAADANCQAMVPDYSNAVDDNCACASDDNSEDCVGRHRIKVTQDPAAGTMVGLGAHPIHLTANDGSSNNDGAGNTTEKTITLTVTDTTNPVITCPANITTSSDPGTCSATVDPGTATATDNCSNPTVTGTRSDNQALNAPYPQGTTTITWTATDASGNHSSCAQTVTVNDTENPTITCPANITRGTDPDSCSATVNPGSPTASDNCGSPTVTGVRSDGQALNAPYPKGTTTITWTATDGSGNQSSCTQTITVNDTQAPAISCPANITRSTDADTCSATVDPGSPTASDNCGSPTVTGTRSDGQALNAPYPKGTTTITWTATDSSGNHTSCTQTITVNDTQPPAITCPANITTDAEPGTCAAHVTPGTATASDNCGSTTVTGTRSDGRPLTDTYPVGTTTITWTATDSSGNHSSCTQTITVRDTQPPIITLNGQTPSMWPPNHKYNTFQVTNFVTGVTDNCGGSIAVSNVVITKVTSDEIENGNSDGNTLNDIVIASDCKSVQLRSEREGTSNGRVYTIFFSVTDAAGNKGTASTKVVVPHNPGETAVDSGPHYTVTSNCP